MGPPDVGPAANHAAVDDQDVAIHDFGFRPLHRAPQISCRSPTQAAPGVGSRSTPRYLDSPNSVVDLRSRLSGQASSGKGSMDPHGVVRFLVEALAGRRVQLHQIHGTDVHAGGTLKRLAPVASVGIDVRRQAKVPPRLAPRPAAGTRARMAFVLWGPLSRRVGGL